MLSGLCHPAMSVKVSVEAGRCVEETGKTQRLSISQNVILHVLASPLKPLNYMRPFIFSLVTQPFSAENATFCVLECVQHPMASVIPNATSWVHSAIIHPAASDSSGRSPFLVLSAVYLSCISSVRCFVYLIPLYIFRTIANRAVQTISRCVTPRLWSHRGFFLLTLEGVGGAILNLYGVARLPNHFLLRRPWLCWHLWLLTDTPITLLRATTSCLSPTLSLFSGTILLTTSLCSSSSGPSGGGAHSEKVRFHHHLSLVTLFFYFYVLFLIFVSVNRHVYAHAHTYTCVRVLVPAVSFGDWKRMSDSLELE